MCRLSGNFTVDILRSRYGQFTVQPYVKRRFCAMLFSIKKFSWCPQNSSPSARSTKNIPGWAINPNPRMGSAGEPVINLSTSQRVGIWLFPPVQEAQKVAGFVSQVLFIYGYCKQQIYIQLFFQCIVTNSHCLKCHSSNRGQMQTFHTPSAPWICRFLSQMGT